MTHYHFHLAYHKPHLFENVTYFVNYTLEDIVEFTAKGMYNEFFGGVIKCNQNGNPRCRPTKCLLREVGTLNVCGQRVVLFFPR